MEDYFVDGCKVILRLKETTTKEQERLVKEAKQLINNFKIPFTNSFLSASKFREALKLFVGDLRRIKTICETKLGRQFKAEYVLIAITSSDNMVYGTVDSSGKVTLYAPNNPLPLNKV